MDKFYHDIIDLLCENSRYTPEKIAVMLGKSTMEVKKTIKELEDTGAIVKYSAIINKEKLAGQYVEALIEVKVTPQRSRGFDSIAEEIYKFSEVKSLYLMSGGFDLAVFVEGDTLKDVAMFVSEKLSVIENVVGTSTHFILKKYKIEGVVAEDNDSIKRIPFQP